LDMSSVTYCWQDSVEAGHPASRVDGVLQADICAGPLVARPGAGVQQRVPVEGGPGRIRRALQRELGQSSRPCYSTVLYRYCMVLVVCAVVGCTSLALPQGLVCLYHTPLLVATLSLLCPAPSVLVGWCAGGCRSLGSTPLCRTTRASGRSTPQWTMSSCSSVT